VTSDLKKSVRSLLRNLRRGSTAKRNARQLQRGFEIVDRLEGAGFALWGLQPSFMDQRGRDLQCDATFFRERPQ
jgi:hypothetical protein